jgi:hypothetical protein
VRNPGSLSRGAYAINFNRVNHEKPQKKKEKTGKTTENQIDYRVIKNAP